ncbi:MAG: inositol monophosphatase [Streptosporangiales bacterium]|nr:inositol monophosphatase [Streptosporangiales bacterium]
MAHGGPRLGHVPGRGCWVSENDLDRLLEIAVTAAREAGRMLVQKRPPGRVQVLDTKSSPTDAVTAMDRASEELITERIRAVRPQDGFLGEEGASSAGDSGVRWVIDPIDGTVNYLYDLPEWAVSIAAEVDGEIRVGVVLIPPRGEEYTAILGGGAARGGEPIRCAPPPPLDQALVATGFGYSAARRAVQAEVLRGVITQVRDVRRGGSCAADLCSLACGRVDAYYERGPQYWDYAAAGLIAREAGARVGGLHGRPPSPDLVLAAPPGLFHDLHDLLATLDPERDA